MQILFQAGHSLIRTGELFLFFNRSAQHTQEKPEKSAGFHLPILPPCRTINPMPPLSILVHCQNQVLTLEADATASLAHTLWQSNLLPPRPLCLGIGHCGLCRVTFLSSPPDISPSEKKILSPEEAANGVRLACRHQPEDGMVLRVPGLFAAALPDARILPTAAHDLWLAVDLGTTSVAWQAQDAAGNVAAAGQVLNPQMTAGSDVMSRLTVAATPEGAARLQHCVHDLLRGIVDAVENGRKIHEIGLAANPAMTALALGKDSSGLAVATCRLDYAGGCREHLPGLPPLWVAPQLGPFLGGDVAAGLALLLDAPRPFLLADMGTNGEFLLVREGKPLLATSVPLGPALEGVGMRCGGMAAPGAVLAFHLTPGGLATTVYGDEQTAAGTGIAGTAIAGTGITGTAIAGTGITGTGYLTLVQCLLRLGVLDTNGHFARGTAAMPLSAKLAASLAHDSVDGQWRLPLPGGLFLTAGDVENLLKVRAVFALAVECLLQEAQLSPVEVKNVYLAGALGQHVSPDVLEELGFLSAALARKTKAAGNTSLRGMGLLLRSASGAGQNLRDRLRRELEGCRVLDLAEDSRFQDHYVQQMRF